MAIPDSMVLFSEPRSTSSCKSLSAFSTFLASIMVPTRKSIFPKSSKTISGFKLLSLASVGPAAGVILSIVIFLALRLLFNCINSASISSSSIFLNNNSGGRKL